MSFEITAGELRTARTLLRRWRPEDREPFARLNADPRVMEYFPGVLSRAQSDALIDQIEQGFERHGFGGWALELPGVAALVGFVGLSVPSFAAPFMPAVEIGWRLSHEHWGKGYAVEAARAVLAAGFDRFGLREIVAFTAVPNQRSQRVMVKLGMTHDPADDFDHPALPLGHWLRRHVLYRVGGNDWRG